MIRATEVRDYSQIIEILKSVQEDGDSYFFLDMSEKELIDYWIKPKFSSFVYEQNGDVLGSYILGPVADGRFSHIANAGYVVSKNARGKGIGKKLALHSIKASKQNGYKAIQFVRVVATNQSAIGTWKSVGFQIIGTVPKSFNHKDLGLVDSYIFYREV